MQIGNEQRARRDTSSTDNSISETSSFYGISQELLGRLSWNLVCT